MKYRRLSANYVFTLSEKPLKNGIVVTDVEGKVVDIIDVGENFIESEGVEHYSGILCPGFINAHCHFENSHLKGKIEENRSSQNTFIVTCPKANLNLENQLPDYKLLSSSGIIICIGTDSLSSNHTLSILDEMKIIGEKYSEITVNELLEWACINGAKAWGIDDWAGSIEIGKKPGINLITGVDLKTMKLKPNSKVRKML